MKVGQTRDINQIKELTPEQIAWLDQQILAKKGLAPVMFGDKTFGDRIYDESSADNNNILGGAGAIVAGGALGLPFDNKGYPIPEPLPPLPGYQPLDPEELGPNHTGHGGGLDNIEFPNHTGGNQIPEPLPPLPGYEPLDPAWINNVFTADSGKGTGVISNTEQAIKNVDPKSLISRQNSNEISGSDIKRLVKDMKANGFDTTQPIDVAIVNGKMIIIDGHHRAAAAVKAGIKDIPIRINKVTEAQGNQLLLEAAEARSRY